MPRVLIFTNLDLFCIDNARVIYRKIRYITLEDGTDGLSRNVVNSLLCVTFQKREDLSSY